VKKKIRGHMTVIGEAVFPQFFAVDVNTFLGT